MSAENSVLALRLAGWQMNKSHHYIDYISALYKKNSVLEYYMRL
jgi:hypothetical protein